MTDNIEVFIQNSIRIRTDGQTVYIDPFRMKESPNDADYIFITHDHYDHFSPEDIGKVCRKDTILIVPGKMKNKTKDVSGMVGRIETVLPGEHRIADGLEFETVPAYNNMKPFHPKSAGWVGYVLILENERVYIAGDTDATEEAKQVKCNIALVPIGGTYTMNAKKQPSL